MLFTWLGKFYSCPCSIVLIGPSWVLLNKICNPFFTQRHVNNNNKEYKKSLPAIFIGTSSLLALRFSMFIETHFQFTSLEILNVHRSPPPLCHLLRILPENSAEAKGLRRYFPRNNSAQPTRRLAEEKTAL